MSTKRHVFIGIITILTLLAIYEGKYAAAFLGLGYLVFEVYMTFSGGDRQ